MPITFPGERALAGQWPERLPTKPPLAMLQRVVRKGRLAQGASRTLLQRRMPIGCATRFEVESAMNHRRRRTVLCDACFSSEALNAFNAGDAHLHATQDGLTRAAEQYVKDIRVSNLNSYICQ